MKERERKKGRERGMEREGNGEKEGRGKGRKGREHQDFCYSLRYSPPQMMYLSGRLEGRGIQRGEVRREGE